VGEVLCLYFPYSLTVTYVSSYLALPHPINWFPVWSYFSMVWFMYYPLWYYTIPNPRYSVLGPQGGHWVHLFLLSLFPFLAPSCLTSELRFYDSSVVYALISFPFYVLPYFSAKNSPFLYQANFTSRIDGALRGSGSVTCSWTWDCIYAIPGQVSYWDRLYPWLYVSSSFIFGVQLCRISLLLFKTSYGSMC
jgi:hypothetical protein